MLGLTALRRTSVGRRLVLLVLLRTLAAEDLQVARAQPPAPRHVATFTGEAVPGDVRFSPDCKTLAISFLDRVIFWDSTTRRVQRTLQGAQISETRDVVFSPDGKWLAARRLDVVRLWDLATGKAREVNPKVQGGYSAMAYAPDGRTLALGRFASDIPGGHEFDVRLWDLTADRERAAWRGKGSVFALAFSPDGRTLTGVGCVSSARAAGELWIWDVASQRLRHNLRANDDWLMCLAVSPDSRVLATADSFQVIRLWDLAAARTRGTWHAGMRSLSALAFSPDGRVLLAAGGHGNLTGLIAGPGQVRFWEAASGQEILTLPAHDDDVESMALSADGNLLAVATSRNHLRTVNVWDVSAVTGRKFAQRAAGAPAQGENLTPKALQALWVDLAGDDAARAYRAIRALAQTPEQAVALLQRHLRPMPRPDPKRIDQLVAELGHDLVAVRQKASQELETLGELAEPTLRRALAGQPSAEARRRIELLLQRLEGGRLSADQLRALRALAVLEQIATPEATRLLRALSEGTPNARLTYEVQATLARLRQ